MIGASGYRAATMRATSRGCRSCAAARIEQAATATRAAAGRRTLPHEDERHVEPLCRELNRAEIFLEERLQLACETSQLLLLLREHVFHPLCRHAVALVDEHEQRAQPRIELRAALSREDVIGD